MARVLFAIWPFVGHINPFVPVAHALQVHGHAVGFYTAASAAPVLAAEGFSVFPFDRVDERSAWNAVIQAESAAARGQASLGVWRAFRDWIAGTVTDQVEDLMPLAHHWKPDVIVAETAMWGPILVVWERLNIPVVVASTLLGCLIPSHGVPPRGWGLPTRGPLAPLFGTSIRVATDLLTRGMRQRLNRVRAQYGLPALRSSVNEFLAGLPLYIIPSLAELDYNRADLPTTVHYVGPCVWNKPSTVAAPAWLTDRPGDRPLVHVTEGTVHYQEPFLLRAAARGLANLPVDVVMTTGPQRDPRTLGLGPLAPNVRVEQWIPHADLLPRCATMVTTGGAGTVMAGLQAGVPMVIVPTLWDKTDNARRIKAVGAGEQIAPRDCTPERLKSMVTRVLSDAQYRTNSERMAKRLAAAPGPRLAAELIAGIAGGTAA